MVRLRQVLRGQCGRPWPAPVVSGLNILPSRVTAAQAKATGATAQWTAFKSRLDSQLNSVVQGGYEGGAVPWAMDYALGYQCLKNSDPTTAAKYADKGVALLWTNFSDLVRSSSQSLQFLAQGDGTTTTFTLPNTPIPGTFAVYLGTVSATAVVRGGTANGQDGASGSGFGTDATAIKIVATNDITAAPAYVKGTDWQQVGSYLDGTIDWSPAGSEPTSGTTYYVVKSSGAGLSKKTTGFTQSGTTLTMSVALTSSQALFVEYLYTDANGNPYRQTGCGFGGYNYILVDTGFTGRYIRHLAAAADWLWGYANFPTALQSLIIATLKSWQAKYYNNTGSGPPTFSTLSGGTFPSNYTAGYYGAQLFSALALTGRDAAASTLLSQIATWRSTYLQPAFTGGGQSLQGGQPPEWWNYGPQTLEIYLTAADAYTQSGNGTFSDEQSWAADILNCLTLERPTASQMITAATYAFPQPFPPPASGSANSAFLSMACALSSDATKASWGNYMLQNQYSGITTDANDLLYRDPSATAANYVSSRPLAAYIPGPLTFLSRADNTDTGTFVWFDLGNAQAAHYAVPFATGHMGIQRGSDLLVYNGNDPGGAAGVGGSQACYANIVLCDDAGAGYQAYDIASNGGVPKMGLDNNPPPFPTGYEATGSGGLDVAGSGYAYAGTQDLFLSYVKNTNLSLHTCQHFQRRVLHVRPDYIFVHDRIQLTLATFTAWQQWHSLGTLTLGGANNWTYAVGSSKLFGQCYSAQGLTTTSATPTVNGHVVNQVKHALTTGTTTPFTFMTALQSAPSATVSMDASTYIASGDARFDGVLIGTVLALFPQGDDVNPWSGTTSYSATYSGTITHYICGVQPSRTFTVGVSVGSGPGTATSSAGGVLTFQTTGTGAAQTVTLS